MEKAKFTYLPLHKAFEKQIKIIKNHDEKQIKALEEHWKQLNIVLKKSLQHIQSKNKFLKNLLVMEWRKYET